MPESGETKSPSLKQRVHEFATGMVEREDQDIATAQQRQLSRRQPHSARGLPAHLALIGINRAKVLTYRIDRSIANLVAKHTA
jgi:hypothetical protein